MAFTMEGGADVLRTSFASVVAHHLRGALEVTDASAVVAYVAATRAAYEVGDDDLDVLHHRVATRIERDGAFTVTTASGCFVCS